MLTRHNAPQPAVVTIDESQPKAGNKVSQAVSGLMIKSRSLTIVSSAVSNINGDLGTPGWSDGDFDDDTKVVKNGA
ncbi:hypothetical protein NEOLI_005009 [Neolecta irregularis DAH-3]|uniref:Uncharacterized protein n=1 Tax=Neolecta irregularis (strain DAH-3) TaxID=1198029 RepID=A0A1U7LL81_NEOID|nr:hypothetical protein NEOLI_005009 [Neolecta irregularis DAH-3]|eukprot:OLL23415.1 hypothetical protein NEOLI_005009 [Neolecta irregularis DAH-3]